MTYTRVYATFREFYNFLLASYDSIVLVWMTQEVSPRCQYSDLVVMVRVALQLGRVQSTEHRIQTDNAVNDKRFFIVGWFLLVKK